MIKKFLTIASLLLCVSLAGFGQVKQVVILDIIDKGNTLDDFDKMVLRGQFSSAITNADGYEAYTRIDIESIDQEWKLRLTGVVSEELVKEIGSKTGVDYILKVEAMRKDGNLALYTEIISAKTTKVEKSAIAKSSQYNGDEDKLVENLISKLFPKKGGGGCEAIVSFSNKDLGIF